MQWYDTDNQCYSTCDLYITIKVSGVAVCCIAVPCECRLTWCISLMWVWLRVWISDREPCCGCWFNTANDSWLVPGSKSAYGQWWHVWEVHHDNDTHLDEWMYIGSRCHAWRDGQAVHTWDMCNESYTRQQMQRATADADRDDKPHEHAQELLSMITHDDGDKQDGDKSDGNSPMAKIMAIVDDLDEICRGPVS